MQPVRRTPHDVKQGKGGKYVQFSGVINLQDTKAGTYAVSQEPIQGKSSSFSNQPAPVTVSDFRCKIPSNAVVKKIVVHYRHSRRALCSKNKSNVPCGASDTSKRCNIPAPIISIPGQNNLFKKGQAPYAKINKKTYGKIADKVTFDTLLPASVVNSKDFGVKIEYYHNTNEEKGYLLLNYLYIDVYYDTPSFTLSANTANTKKVYNKQDYHLKVNLSDSNLTRKTTTVNITAPLGFTYKGTAGTMNGKITQISGRNLQWTPNMKNSNGAVELIFETNVSFAQGETSNNFDFHLSLPSITPMVQKTHTATIYKPSPEMETEEVEKDIFTDDDTQTTSTKQVWGILNNSFLLSLELTPEEIETYSHEGELPLSFRAYSGETSSSNWYYSNIDNETLSQLSPSAWRVIDNDDNYIFNDYFKVMNNIGEYTLQVYAIVGGVIEQGMTEVMIRELKIRIKPQLNTLTDINYAILGLTEEELHRLGDGYNYTVQSNMKLDTSESYVRDWYKNFRLGVFNNPILENISTYYQYDNMEESFNGYISIPSYLSLEEASLQISADKSINLNINDTQYTVHDPVTMSLTDYLIPVTFTKIENDNIILTITTYNNNTQTYTIDYHINFNATETTDIQEITTDTTDYNNLTNDEILANTEYWGDTLTDVNTTESITVEFPYQSKYPLYILITGDYAEGDIQDNNIKFTEPCIIETTQFTEKRPNGEYPVPIDDVILTDGSSSEITLNSYTTSDTIVLYNLPLDDHYGTDTTKAIRGIELVGEIQQADTLVLSAKLKSPTGDSKERSIVINEEALTDGVNSFSMGGNGDLWGFNTLDIVELERWEIEFTIANNLEESDASINFGNIKLILYIEEVDQQNIKCYIDGQDIAYYGVFLTDVKIPEGLETDTAYLSVDGTDINDAYRQNIREKEIEIEFDIGDGCSLEAATLSLREFAKLLVNDRDEYNRPIPKRIEFSHYPDVYWEYVMEKGLESEININTYEVKAKLTVPAGTSYDKVNTTTSNTGYVNGLASINPTLIVKPTSETITIRETISGQEFHIGYTGGWDDKILEIDCEDRICWMKTNEEDTDPVNLNRYIDYNSDWFVLKEDYAFEGVNCVIRTVDYAERW